MILGAGVVLAIASQVLAGLGGAVAKPPAPIAESATSPSAEHATPSLPLKPQLTEAERAKILEKATKGLKRERDQMEKTTFYLSSAGKSLKTGVGTYIGLADGKAPYLRMNTIYYGDRWIFFDKVKIMADDAIVFERQFRRSAITRDNTAGAVWEIADIVAGAQELATLEAITKSKSATIRFAGRDRIHDHKISSSEKARLKSVLDAYNTLKLQL